MSRIGKKLIKIPSGVSIEIKEDALVIKGPKGELNVALLPHCQVTKETIEGEEILRVGMTDVSDSALWGTMRALVNNAVKGVTEGFTKSLELNGVGLRMSLAGSTLKLQLGFTHDVEFLIPKGIEAKVENNVITLVGVDAQLVGQVAAQIRALKKPEPYKGKGFRYTDEIIRRKVGKAVGKTE